ncbi:C-type lectin domain family 2 member A-like isoform X4 [Tachyglossus aculeatus]|uniref:C-type lectin domain family 2 member A-like isoform X4 n=1 Tax=Tachyglossus aculeatus TaxID=9261 RepID=UPI0018F3C151|nr:C-type lectin domain family 2 member A-like isoform X4 [Tachyglossus aculeatus]
MDQGDHATLHAPEDTPGCEPQKLTTVFMIVISAVALVTLIVLAVTLGAEARTWEGSKHFCASLEATLSKIATKEELDLLKKEVGRFDFWIGLSRKKDSIWRWTDDDVFNSLFLISGGGECAYLDTTGVKSTTCHQPRRYLCSKAGICRQKRGGIPHMTYGVESERT